MSGAQLFHGVWPRPSRKAVSEAAIFGLGGVSIFLVNNGPGWVDWASLFGLSSQVFWIRDTWRNREWGKFGLSLWFTFNWLRGLCRLLGWPDPVSLIF